MWFELRTVVKTDINEKVRATRSFFWPTLMIAFRLRRHLYLEMSVEICDDLDTSLFNVFMQRTVQKNDLSCIPRERTFLYLSAPTFIIRFHPITNVSHVYIFFRSLCKSHVAFFPPVTRTHICVLAVRVPLINRSVQAVSGRLHIMD